MNVLIEAVVALAVAIPLFVRTTYVGRPISTLTLTSTHGFAVGTLLMFDDGERVRVVGVVDQRVIRVDGSRFVHWWSARTETP